jgi:hypothetical protein
MSVCSYVYASGLRIESGRATVDLDGKTYRVVRDGKGASRLIRPSVDPLADGEITLKDLQARLTAQGLSSVPVTARTASGTFSVQLDPTTAMGRQGRQGDFASALAAMPPRERRAAAMHQLTTLPLSAKNDIKDSQARLAAALAEVHPAVASRYLNAGFAAVADDSTFMQVLAASPIEDVLKLGATRLDPTLFALAQAAADPNYEAREEKKRQDVFERERLLSRGIDGIRGMLLKDVSDEDAFAKVLKLAPEIVEEDELIGELAVKHHLLLTLEASPETVKRNFATNEAVELLWRETTPGRTRPALYRALAQVIDAETSDTFIDLLLLERTRELLPHVADAIADESIELLWSNADTKVLVAKHAPHRLSQQQVDELYAESPMTALQHLPQRLSQEQLQQGTYVGAATHREAAKLVARHAPHMITDRQLADLLGYDRASTLEEAAELLSTEQIVECFERDQGRTLKRAPHLIPQELITGVWESTWGADEAPNRNARSLIVDTAFFRLDGEQRAWVLDNMPDALLGTPASGHLDDAQLETAIRARRYLERDPSSPFPAMHRATHKFYRAALARTQ